MTMFKEITVDLKPGTFTIPDGAEILTYGSGDKHNTIRVTYLVPVKPVVREAVMTGWFDGTEALFSDQSSALDEWRGIVTLIDGVPQSEVKWEKL